jgi:streptogramin lyase
MHRPCPIAPRRFSLPVVALSLLALFAWTWAAAGPNPGDLLVTDRGTQSVLYVNPVTGAQSILTSGGFLSRPEAVVANPAGDIFVVEADRFGVGSKIVKVDASTGSQSVLASGGALLDPHDIVVRSDGMLLVADFSGPHGSGGIILVNPVTGTQTVLLDSQFGAQPFDLVMEVTGTVIFTTFNAFASPLRRFDPASASVVMLNADVGGASGVAVEASGQVLVADEGPFGNPGHIFRVDPVSGARSVVTTGSSGRYGDVAVEPGGAIFVSGEEGILRVDPTTGAQVTVSTGGLFVDLGGLSFFKSGSPTPAARVSWGKLKARYR